MRRLTPNTIIPSSLYVRRGADRQLSQVIADMGRPGYVLVARQMGKTNLLLNAKREIETALDVVVYADLSAPFSSDKECFRHIIDIALETQPELFKSVNEPIQNARVSSALPAYKEHEIELRHLLSKIQGKLVIILDEIDSLTKSNFSDRIFAQIRSVYFSRTNYPQFKRLTYILSGVAEPSEIIKDKKISPFNIGEKIYLDDFSREEFQDFLSKADLQLTGECADHVYYWTQGNPRITWDVCSEIEDQIHNGFFITPESIDASLQKLYFDDFSRPPVDHIREVVSDDDALQSAITVIKYGKGDTLPDALKTRLYLSGIIRSSAKTSELKIKNPIIEKALSDQWLRDIAINRKGLLKLADEKFEESRFSEALDLYESFFKKESVPKEKSNLAYFHSGICAYRMGAYDKAVGMLEKCTFDSEDSAAAFADCEYVQGVCLLQMRNYEKAIEKFKIALKSPRKTLKHVTSQANIGSALSALNRYSESLDALNNALITLRELASDSEEANQIYCLCHLNLSSAYAALNNKDGAVKHMNLALERSQAQNRPAILLEILRADPSNPDKRGMIKDAIETILKDQLKPVPIHPENNMLFTQQHVWILLREAFILDSDLFSRLHQYTRNFSEFDLNQSEIFLNLALYSLNRVEFNVSERFLKASLSAYENESSTPFATKFSSTRLLCLLSEESNKLKLYRAYLKCFEGGFRPAEIDSVDLTVFSKAISTLNNDGFTEEALAAIQIAKSFYNLVKEENKSHILLIFFHEMIIRQKRNEFLKLRKVSEETISFIDALNQSSLSENSLNKEDMGQIKSFALSNITPNVDYVIRSVYGSPQKNRVTVKYQDGRIKKNVKLKQVELDLKNKLCVIIDL